MYLKLLILFFLIPISLLSSELSVSSHTLIDSNQDTVLFVFDDFSDLSQWQLNNHAEGATDDANRKVLRMTRTELNRYGSAFIKESVPLVGNQGFKASFSAFFSYRMHQPGGINDPDGTGADGIVFVVQTVANNVGSSGGGIGYKGIRRSLGIEYDSWYNPENRDADGNHIGIDTGGVIISFKSVNLPDRINDGDIWYTWIDYNGKIQVLEVRHNSVNVRPSDPILVDTLDLPTVLQTENAYVGFTGATGAAYNFHDILTFKFINTIDPFDNNLIDNQTFSVMENSPAGTFVGLVATNPNQTDPITLSELIGVPEFDFNPGNREITVANGAVLDFETQNQYQFTLEASMPLTQGNITIYDTAVMTINILDSIELPDPADIDSAVIYDTDGNGIGDSILCVFAIDPQLWLPRNLDFNWPLGAPAVSVSTNSTQINGRHITFDFTPANNAPILTTGEGLMKAFYDSLSTNFEKTGPLFDGIGPLLKDEALLLQRFNPGNDTLYVSFTEKVRVTEIRDKSFILIKKGINKEIELTLLDPAIDLGNEDSIQFAIGDLGTDAPEEGDSIKILDKGPVVDNPRNNHAHKNNTPVPIRMIEKTVYVNVIKAAYFDQNADGYVDSIYTKVTTDLPNILTEELVKEIVANAVTLPPFRGFSISHTGLTADGIYMKVSEDKAHNPVTYVTSEDQLVTKDFTTSIGVKVKAGSVEIIDKVAPIIHWQKRAAFLIDYMDSTPDTLKVKFSEPIKKITADQPFYFLDHDNNTIYQVTLRNTDHPQPDQMTFIVDNVNGVTYMEEGDSLWIQESDLVQDEKGNAQNNPQNTRRKLYVKRIPLPYQFIPKAVSPVAMKNLLHENVIPRELISVLEQNGILENLQLEKNKNGDYCGMIIMVVPEPENIGKYIPDLKLTGRISLYDAVGNHIIALDKMAWWDDQDKKCLVYVWNLRNRQGRLVAPGSYVSVIELKDITKSLGLTNNAKQDTKKILLGVK